MSKEEAKGEVKVKRSDLTVVAEDTNWRKYCANDLRVAGEFNENWGFLTKAAQSKYLNDGLIAPVSYRWRASCNDFGRQNCVCRD
jgi:hypothetical protein